MNTLVPVLLGVVIGVPLGMYVAYLDVWRQADD